MCGIDSSSQESMYAWNFSGISPPPPTHTCKRMPTGSARRAGAQGFKTRAIHNAETPYHRRGSDPVEYPRNATRGVRRRVIVKQTHATNLMQAATSEGASSIVIILGWERRFLLRIARLAGTSSAWHRNLGVQLFP